MGNTDKLPIMSFLWTLGVLVLGAGILLVVIHTVGPNAAANACHNQVMKVVPGELSHAEKRMLADACGTDVAKP